MKKYFFALTLLLALTIPIQAQTMNTDKTIQERISAIEDRTALKELVDTFSILADKKDVKAQVQLFTANAELETYQNGALVSKLTGRKAMEESFGAFLGNFQTVYHFNGQQTVKLDGDKATGVSYCMVTLIGVAEGKNIKTSIGVYYEDEYVQENNQWLIAKRKAVFDWQDKRELGK